MLRWLALAILAVVPAFAQTSVTASSLFDPTAQGALLNGSVIFTSNTTGNQFSAAVTNGVLGSLSLAADTYIYVINNAANQQVYRNNSYAISGSGTSALDVYINSQQYFTANGSVYIWLTRINDIAPCVYNGASSAPTGTLPGSPANQEVLTVLNPVSGACSVTGQSITINTYVPVPALGSATYQYATATNTWTQIATNYPQNVRTGTFSGTNNSLSLYGPVSHIGTGGATGVTFQNAYNGTASLATVPVGTFAVIADNNWATVTGGDIQNAVSAVAGNVYLFVCDGTSCSVK